MPLDLYPWLTLLPDVDREAFAAELRGCPPEEVPRLVREWATTARIHGDPELVERLTGPIEL